MNANVFSIYAIVALAAVLFGGFSFQLNEIQQKNTILTQDSQALLDNFTNEIDQSIPIDNLAQPTNNENITSGSGVEDFSREFRESRSIAERMKDNINTVKNLPTLIVVGLGLPIDPQIANILVIIGFTLGVMILLSIYIFWKTGEVKNR